MHGRDTGIITVAKRISPPNLYVCVRCNENRSGSRKLIVAAWRSSYYGDRHHLGFVLLLECNDRVQSDQSIGKSPRVSGAVWVFWWRTETRLYQTCRPKLSLSLQLLMTACFQLPVTHPPTRSPAHQPVNQENYSFSLHSVGLINNVHYLETLILYHFCGFQLDLVNVIELKEVYQKVWFCRTHPVYGEIMCVWLDERCVRVKRKD